VHGKANIAARLKSFTWWHGICPEGFGGVWGLAAPSGLRRRASGRWLVSPMALAWLHAEKEAKLRHW